MGGKLTGTLSDLPGLEEAGIRLKNMLVAQYRRTGLGNEASRLERDGPSGYPMDVKWGALANLANVVLWFNTGGRFPRGPYGEKRDGTVVVIRNYTPSPVVSGHYDIEQVYVPYQGKTPTDTAHSLEQAGLCLGVAPIVNTGHADDLVTMDARHDTREIEGEEASHAVAVEREFQEFGNSLVDGSLIVGDGLLLTGTIPEPFFNG